MKLLAKAIHWADAGSSAAPAMVRQLAQTDDGRADPGLFAHRALMAVLPLGGL
jgi:hypothetical protein